MPARMQSGVNVRLSVLVASILLPFGVQAQTFMFDDAEDMDTTTEEAWEASAEFGLLFTTGNTETESLKAKLNVAKDIRNWRHKGVLDYYTAEQENQDTGETTETADRLFLSAQSNYKFEPNSKSSLFIFGSYEEDVYSGYEYQSTLAIGYGARYRYSENLYADYEVGPGYSRVKPVDENRNPLEAEGSAILRLAGSMTWDISENSRFNALVSSEIGEENTKSRAEVSISSNINSSLALKVSVSGTHNSEVANEDIENLDTETAVTVVYTF
ncbi:DUF481 domain-containing protein [Idiomarina baltica]|nr:DUF481 domain-containing protein [Idiomarina baltica]MEC8925755.1 DUF481 domain-containing protein [Pseudomonadota bacterium]